MTIEDYKKELEVLKQQFEENKRSLIVRYCRANIKYQVGEIVTDHIGSIRVENHAFYIDYDGNPAVNYKGVELKKDLKPFKRASVRTVCQNNIL